MVQYRKKIDDVQLHINMLSETIMQGKVFEITLQSDITVV